ncbi:MAG: S9 family peptidase, partial [Flavobacteriales bacterium]
MKRIHLSIGCALLLAACAPSAPDAEPTNTMKKLDYPVTAKEDVQDSLWGQSIEDPYRWLEDDMVDDTKDWVKAQNKVTRSFLDSIPFKKAIASRYESILDYEKVGSPYKVGDNYFISKNSGLQNQSVIYIQNGEDGKQEVFLDPNTLSADGTVTTSLMGASEDNKFMAISRSEAGSDWSEIRVMNIADKKETGDVLKWVKFGGASWYKDGFFYSRYPAPEAGDELSAENTFHQVYYHKLGQAQSEDELIYQNLDAPNMYHWCGTTEDDKYLLLYASTGTNGYEVYFKDLEKGSDFQTLFSGFKNKSTIVEHVNGRFLVQTDIDAPKYRLVSIDPNNSDQANWIEILPESEDLLESVSTAGGKMFATYLAKASNKIEVMDYDGSNRKTIQLPDNTGSAGGFYGKKEDKKLFYSFTSFTYPTSVYEYNIESGESSLYYAPKLKFNPADFESKQVM